ncbi:hypothetical protein H072_4286 [Dactylellina haptotyla CBS 200.50]|uniref:PEBP-like protein n=1 Tax=Dactylellina haptotyla (strain CBS 200.50) TaxID=1284197 RepID=S8AFZ0_DACHA|nr:hypothetical protein H072_4286 [Dactylellina haptotyla CBS 200.50]
MAARYLTALLALAGTAISQTPQGFSPSVSQYLPVTYDTSANPSFFANGGVFDKRAVQTIPEVYVPDLASLTGQTFIVLMVDPDAPSPQNNSLGQILHWLQPGVKVPIASKKVRGPNNSTTYIMLDTTLANAIAPYRGPAPPSQDPHRYIFMLFLQPKPTFTLPAGFERFEGGNDRRQFNADAFVKAAGLDAPIAGNYFLAGASTQGDGGQATQGFDMPSSNNSTSGSNTSEVGAESTRTPTSNGNDTSPTFPTPTPSQTHNGAIRLKHSVSGLIVVFAVACFLI